MVDSILNSVLQAIELIISLDPVVLEITLRSLYVSGLAIGMASLWSIPIALLLGLRNFRGKRFIRGLFHAFIGIPTVTLGLILFLAFSRSGPLGGFQLLFTPIAISIGQAILITPIAVSFITSAIEAIDVELRDLARTLGASELQASLAIFREAQPAVALALIASFNRAFAELGIAMMLGGNIYGYTRVLTTAIALETAKGDVSLSIALAVILMAIVTTLSLTMNYLRKS